MDPIESNPFFNSARLYQNQVASQKPSAPAEGSTTPSSSIDANNRSAAPADFSNMFDDDALLKLQGNLEAIAQMAEKSLKQIDG
ncbi:hypothetical protein [Pelagicoccus mobilis]|uniref:Uncharacterized protein n=1 Tax=Pelagicoccus mobilis TaxID=415221 RepID=A0A934RV50_9BACT|nr:hypothetical protein [Pelagicoccus mobilis]MBK1877397.1 hypothetical protein [Pelagicoccus mobilis]